MAEYIDRHALLDHIKKDPLFDLVERYGVSGVIESFPAADVVERKTGKWNRISPAGIYECNQCGQNVMTSDIEAYKFCHGCGAQMIGGDDDGT